MIEETLKEREKDLFARWRQAAPQNEVLIRDGAMNPFHYLHRKLPKTMFILKEAWGEEEEDWDLRDVVLTEWCNWRTWNNVTRWKIALDALHHDARLDIDTLWDDRLTWIQLDDRTRELKDIAVFNLKKAQGGTRSNMNVVYQWASRNMRLLEEQFTILDPDIVVVCGSDPGKTPFLAGAEVVWDHYSRTVQATRVPYPDRERIVIYQWHPQASINAHHMVASMIHAVRPLLLK